MNTNLPKLLSILILTIIISISLYLRFIPLIESPLPINDGGLFYKMTVDLVGSKFLLPKYTSYNNLNIPFVYPPLGIYVLGIISSLAKISPFAIITFLPTLIFIFSIIIFYYLSYKFFRNLFAALLTTTIYAFMPKNYLWITMGGGVTRAWGEIFAITTCLFTLFLIEQKSRKWILLVSLSLALTTLSHLAWGSFAALSIILIILGSGQKEKIKSIGLVFFLGFLLLLPWLLILSWRFGISPLSAMLSSFSADSFSTDYFILIHNFTLEATLPLIDILGLLGFVLELSSFSFLLPVWFILTFFLDRHDAGNIAVIPFALLAGKFATFSIALPFQKNLSKLNSKKLFFYLKLILPISGASILFFIIFLNSAQSWQYEVQLSKEDISTIAWISKNIKINKRFLILSPNTIDLSWGSDSLSEWFPALSGNQSLLTLQGREWLSKNNFSRTFNSMKDLSLCNPLFISCLKYWSLKENESFDYLLISDFNYPKFGPLIYSLSQDRSFKLIYKNSSDLIIKKVNSNFIVPNHRN